MSSVSQSELPDFLFKNASCVPPEQHAGLAPYASFPENSRGRLHPEPERAFCSVFRRDCDRIVHSAAFRRLEYKTQVFVNHEGDHFRTRLTHTLEAAQIARSLCRTLSLNEDLAEAAALAHDLGHAPFGHAGEVALREAAAGIYIFNHNAQSMKLLTTLERRYADFDGLNLTWETLEAVAKHNGPFKGRGHPVPEPVAMLDDRWDLKGDLFPSAEAQIASLADEIAYNAHDIDDGLRAGLFTISELNALPMVANIFRELRETYPHVEEQRIIYEASRRLIHRMIVDLTRNTLMNIEKFKVRSSDDVRMAPGPIACFSKPMQSNVDQIKLFLNERMYRHYRVCRMTNKAKRTVRELFKEFFLSPGLLPTEWYKRIPATGSDREKAIVITDYIAGMTDRFAHEELRRLTDLTFRT